MNFQNNYIYLLIALEGFFVEALLIQQYQVSFTAVSATLVLIPVFKPLHKHKRHVYFGFQVKWITDHLQTFTEIQCIAVQSKFTWGK